MKKVKKNERILRTAAGILLLGMLLVLAVLPGILGDTSSNSNPMGAGIAISLAFFIRLVIFAAYIKVIRSSRKSSTNRKGEYMAIGVLLILFGLIYTDGAFAFLSPHHMLYISVLMFATVVCDLLAAILTIRVYFLKPQKVEEGETIKPLTH